MNEWITTSPFGMSKSRNSKFLCSSLLTVKVNQKHRGKACYIHRSYHIYAHIIFTSLHSGSQPGFLRKKVTWPHPCLLPKFYKDAYSPGLYGHGSEAKTFCTPQLKMKLRSPYRKGFEFEHSTNVFRILVSS